MPHLAVPLIVKRAVNKAVRPLGINPFPRAFNNPLAGSPSDRATIFDLVYSRNFWGSGQSRSGNGSELAFTARYRKSLADLMNRRGFTSIFDAPCGDLNWMAELARENAWRYAGGDISDLVIEEVRASHPDFDARVFDICEAPFPEADVWHCRDCLFHLPFADIGMALRNFCRSRIPYLLLTTHKARLLHQNLDVSVGGFRYVDVERPPICLPPAEEYLPDYRFGVEFPRYVGLWSRETVERTMLGPNCSL